MKGRRARLPPKDASPAAHGDTAPRRWNVPGLSAELAMGQGHDRAVLLRSADAVGLFSLDDVAEIVAGTSRFVESQRGHDSCFLSSPGAGAPSSGAAETTQGLLGAAEAAQGPGEGAVALLIDRAGARVGAAETTVTELTDLVEWADRASPADPTARGKTRLSRVVAARRTTRQFNAGAAVLFVVGSAVAVGFSPRPLTAALAAVLAFIGAVVFGLILDLPLPQVLKVILAVVGTVAGLAIAFEGSAAWVGGTIAGVAAVLAVIAGIYAMPTKSGRRKGPGQARPKPAAQGPGTSTHPTPARGERD